MPLPKFMELARWVSQNSDATGSTIGAPNVVSPSPALSQVLDLDMFGTTSQDPHAPVSRIMAMRQPAVARSRGILVTLARYPLVAWRGSERLKAQPKWLSRTDTEISPQQRMTDSMDDALFQGRCLWMLQRDGAIKPTGRITDAVRLPPNMWKETPQGEVSISTDDGKWFTIPYEQRGVYAKFRSFQDGFLTIGASVVRTSEGIQRGIAGRALSPIPLIDLHLASGMVLDPEEKAQLRSDWVSARNSPEGAVAITPNEVEARVLGEQDASFLDTARNSQRIDVANLIHLPAALIDGSTSTASLTYSTQEGRRVELNDYGLSLWRTIFESRLSMDDITPSGTRIEIDLSELAQVPDDGTGPTLED